MGEEIFKDLEKDIERRRRDESEREKKRLTGELEKHDARLGNKAPQSAILFSIIILLALYIAYDHVFVHPKALDVNKESPKLSGNTVDAKSIDAPKAAVQNATLNKTEVVQNITKNLTASNASSDIASENKSNATSEVVPKLSGIVTLTIDYVEKEKASDTLGYMKSVSFTIENGKDKEIAPVVDVFAFDSKSVNEMGGVSRGTYNKGKSTKIQPGEKHSVNMPISPKSFSNIELPKTVNIVLKYSDADVVKATTEVIIS